MSEYPWNKRNNTFTWLSSLYNPFKLLSRLQLKFSHLNKHKLHDNFKDAPSPMCDCSSETELTDLLKFFRI